MEQLVELWPVQVEQEASQLKQEVEFLKDPSGQVATHCVPNKRRFPEQVRQEAAVPEQVAQEVSQSVQIRLIEVVLVGHEL